MNALLLEFMYICALCTQPPVCSLQTAVTQLYAVPVATQRYTYFNDTCRSLRL